MLDRRKLLVSIASIVALGATPSLALAQAQLKRRTLEEVQDPDELPIEEEAGGGRRLDDRRPQIFEKPRVKPELQQQVPAPSNAPSAAQIERSLDATPRRKIRREDRVSRKDFRRDLRRRSPVRENIRIAAPSIDIQAINFEFGSARIPYEEQWKVEEIATAMRRILRRNPGELFLIEGHTDAVGSNYANQLLSEDRAASLKSVLVRRFGVDAYALETIGYGEEYLLVPTAAPEWRNRRVTLRTVTDFILR